jgi:hypothetical protein
VISPSAVLHLDNHENCSVQTSNLVKLVSKLRCVPFRDGSTPDHTYPRPWLSYDHKILSRCQGPGLRERRRDAWPSPVPIAHFPRPDACTQSQHGSIPSRDAVYPAELIALTGTYVPRCLQAAAERRERPWHPSGLVSTWARRLRDAQKQNFGRLAERAMMVCMRACPGVQPHAPAIAIQPALFVLCTM